MPFSDLDFGSWIISHVLHVFTQQDYVRVTIAVVTKATREGKGLFGSYFHITVHHQRKLGRELKQDRDLEAGADVEVVKVAAPCHALHALLRLLSYRTQAHQPR